MKLVAIFALAAGLCCAQPPKFGNAHVESRSSAGNLTAALRGIVAAQSAPAWIAYAVPMIPGQHSMCCDSGCCGDCRTGNTSVALEGPATLYVFYRVENKAIVKIRMFTPNCEIDAGGLAVYWIPDAQPAGSVAFLQSVAAADADGARGERRLANSAISAIAMHKDASAERALDALVATSYPVNVRKDAIFWLGMTRGRHGYETVARIARSDSDDRVREHAVFVLSRSQEPEAVHVLIDIAQHDSSPHVRGQALFWLAQSAERKVAASAIENAIRNDPDTEVKKQAVFALSRLPNGDGVPKLIEIAKTNSNPAVRRQAMFWLGRSRDPRALRFFEDVLTH
jgi:HEAT repeat protein